MSKNKIQKVHATIKFTINTKGRIANAAIVEESYKGFGNYVKSALLRISRKYELNGMRIEPARLKDGTPVDFDFRIPVAFNVQ